MLFLRDDCLMRLSSIYYDIDLIVSEVSHIFMSMLEFAYTVNWDPGELWDIIR